MAMKDLAFAGGGLDRQAFRRRDMDTASRAASGTAAVLWLWDGKVPVREGLDAPALHLAHGLPDAPGAATPLFLGTAPGLGEVMACDLGAGPILAALPPGVAWVEPRLSLGLFDAPEGEIVATARALAGWHASHGYCARCGAASVVAEAGWQRRCPACAALHFPRTDPVVIMLVTLGDEILLGRSPGWPEGMYSALAGFMEPGETIEAAVRREVAEETGIAISRVRYLASQPWPFPASLMIGCHAQAETRDIVLDPAELEDALWVGRQEMVTVMAGRHPRLNPPRRGAIARELVANWLADRLD